jgi:hypothetical protein
MTKSEDSKRHTLRGSAICRHWFHSGNSSRAKVVLEKRQRFIVAENSITVTSTGYEPKLNSSLEDLD